MNRELEAATRSFRPCKNQDCKAECCRYGRFVMSKLEADAQALADVRTLDDWATKNPDAPFATTRGEPDDAMRWCCWREGPPHERCYFYAKTPDEARAKAAAWVREQGKP